MEGRADNGPAKSIVAAQFRLLLDVLTEIGTALREISEELETRLPESASRLREIRQHHGDQIAALLGDFELRLENEDDWTP